MAAKDQWSKKILVVDDDVALRDFFNLKLNKVGYGVILAENGDKGYMEAVGKNPDLILLDINMPGKMDGLAVLEKIRTNNKLTETPVIMLTVRRDRESVEEALKMNADDYVVKPIKMGLLLDRVERLVNKKVEDKWKEMEPAHREVLNLTLNTMVKTLKWALDKGKSAPLREIQHTCAGIIKAVENQEIQPVLDAVKGHSSELFVHALRVSAYMVLFAVNLNQTEKRFAEQDVMDLAMGGLLHDLGMVDVQFVLNKTEKLNTKDWKEMKRHVTFAGKRLKEIPDIQKTVLDIALHHHERVDGSGYPEGLFGKEITIPARMAGIVDTYEALTSRRRYRDRLSPEKALEEMMSWSGHFDEALLRSFSEAVLDTN